MHDDREPLLISKEYSISTPLYEAGFKAFQKKYVYPRNYVMTALFSGIAAYYLFCLRNDIENMLYWLLSAVCLALIVSLWYNPYKLRKNLVKSVENIVDDRYRLEIFTEYMTFGMFQQQDNENTFQHINNGNVEKENPESEKNDSDEAKFSMDEGFFASEAEDGEKTEIRFSPSVRIIEKPEFFLVYIVKSVFYIIPKKDFSEEELIIMQQHFENQLGKNFFRKA